MYSENKLAIVNSRTELIFRNASATTTLFAISLLTPPRANAPFVVECSLVRIHTHGLQLGSSVGHRAKIACTAARTACATAHKWVPV